MSEPRTYNLLYRPWIPVVWASGTVDKVGIRRVLESAHEIHSISHTAPFIEFGLYRLLITIVLDAYIVARKRPTIGKMRQMIEAGKFDECVIVSYLDKHESAFDLWDADRPFLQVKRPDPIKKDDKKAAVYMFSAFPSETNVAFWSHFEDRGVGISDEMASCFLASVSPFNFKGKPGEVRTLPGDPPMYALVLGESLFQTLVLNLPRPCGRGTLKQEIDNGPVWRTPPSDLAKLPQVPTTTQGFTWPVRRIALIPEGSLIREAFNKSFYKDRNMKEREAKGRLFSWRDSNAGTKTGPVVVDHITAQPDVPIWRDAVPLFLVASEGEALSGRRRQSRPEVVTNALRVLEEDEFAVAVYGMRKKSDGGGDVKVEEWFRLVLRLPTEVARDERLSYEALAAFDRAQKVANALQTALRMLRPKMAAVPSERKNLRLTMRGEKDALSGFWQALEPVLASSSPDSFLVRLARQESDATTMLCNRIREAARLAFSAAAAPHRRDADGLFRIANASNYLERRLALLLPKEKDA